MSANYGVALSPALKKRLAKLAKLPLNELRDQYREVTDLSPLNKDRKRLLEKLARHLASPSPATVTTSGLTPTRGADEAAAMQSLKGKTVAELQEIYAETIGRPTNSENRPYLLWKLREAAKGRVPIGPRTVRKTEDMETIPVRIPKAGVVALKQEAEQRGIKSRNRFIENALAHYLMHLGADEAAAHFVAAAATE